MESTELEKKREIMMENEAVDLPFGRREGSWQSWIVLLIGLFLGLTVPFLYIGFSLLGAITVSRVGLVMANLFLFTFMVGALGVIYYLISQKTRFDSYEAIDIKKVMTRRLVVCGYLDSIQECTLEMYRSNVGYMIIEDENDRFIGVVTDRDLVCGAMANNLDLNSTPVTQIMERNIRAVSLNHSLDDVIQLMINEGFRRVPVIENEKCIGLISMDDLIIKKVCSLDQVASILSAQIAEPRKVA